jgi:hypothetical protein
VQAESGQYGPGRLKVIRLWHRDWVVVGLTLLLPYSPLAPLLGLVPLPPVFLVALGPIVLLYVVAAKAAKSVFYRREERRRETDPAVISTRPIGVSH